MCSVKDTAFLWLDPSKAEVVGLSYPDHSTQTETFWRNKRVRHPDLPGVRWLGLNKKRTGWYSRSTEGARWSTATCYFLPTAQAWARYQERQQEAA